MALGAQATGMGVADRRIDIAATAITAGMTVDQLAHLDLSYAPPFSPAMDNILAAANILRNKMDGRMEGITPAAVLALMEEARAAVGEGLTLLPVIQSRFNEAMDRIRTEKEDKCSEIIDCVRTDITLFGGKICDDIIKKIFNKAVAPAIDDFVNTGGKFEVLNNMINARILELEPELGKLIESRKPELEAKMSSTDFSILSNRCLRFSLSSFSACMAFAES